MAEKRQKKIGNKKRELNSIWIKSKETVEGFYLAIPEISRVTLGTFGKVIKNLETA